MTYDDYIAQQQQAMEEEQTDTVENEITVEMLRRGRSWWMNLRPEDFDAMCGGYPLFTSVSNAMVIIAV